MTPREVIERFQKQNASTAVDLLRVLAESVILARTMDDLPLRDASDFRTWLNDLADEFEASEDLDLQA